MRQESEFFPSRRVLKRFHLLAIRLSDPKRGWPVYERQRCVIRGFQKNSWARPRAGILTTSPIETTPASRPRFFPPSRS
jgi:hypothetical protein